MNLCVLYGDFLGLLLIGRLLRAEIFFDYSDNMNDGKADIRNNLHVVDMICWVQHDVAVFLCGHKTLFANKESEVRATFNTFDDRIILRLVVHAKAHMN